MKPRVPAALQQVFLKSSAGEDVQSIRPPKHGLGFKIFQRKDRNLKIKTIIGSAPGKNNNKGSLRNRRKLVVESASESYRKANPISDTKKQERKPINTPQGFLEAALEERGYSTEKYVTIEGGYYCRPTQLQKASFGTRMNEAILNSDATLLRRLLDVGLSPNPCNDFGESLVHRICRRGDHKLLRVLLEKGCCLQIADDYGRTPLHDAFWKAEPSEEVLNLILLADKDLIRLMDCRGFVPLDYVRKECHPDMIRYLTRVLDKFFPKRSESDPADTAPILTQRKPHSTPVPDPKMAMLPHSAALVANGEIEPEDALHWDDSSYDSSDFDSDCDNSFYSDTEIMEDFDLDFDEAELLDLCLRVGGPLAVSKHCLAKKSPIATARSSFMRDGPLNLSNSDISKLSFQDEL
mmetsp:Transcript_11555/g.27806  ORF Transcript_11555/g.27806 Transcript_11555/m.27806 type:complete len:408 (+) Transcript_11555:29-1252(+)